MLIVSSCRQSPEAPAAEVGMLSGEDATAANTRAPLCFWGGESGAISSGNNALNGKKRGQEEGEGRRKRLEKTSVKRSSGQAKALQKSAPSSAGWAEFPRRSEGRRVRQQPAPTCQDTTAASAGTGRWKHEANPAESCTAPAEHPASSANTHRLTTRAPARGRSLEATVPRATVFYKDACFLFFFLFNTHFQLRQ